MIRNDESARSEVAIIRFCFAFQRGVDMNYARDNYRRLAECLTNSVQAVWVRLIPPMPDLYCLIHCNDAITKA